MSAKDHYHDTVKRVLIKNGWIITKEQVAVMVGKRRLFIDLRASTQDRSRTILIEVKGFESPKSQVDALVEAMGQYLLYRFALQYVDIDVPLFLAIPLRAFQGIWNEPLGQLVEERTQISLLVFDPETLEIVEWID